MAHLCDSAELGLKTRYSFLDEYIRPGVRIKGDVKTLLYMIKEHESNLNKIKLTTDDILIILCKEYQERRNVSFWNPNNPQWKRIERIGVKNDE